MGPTLLLAAGLVVNFVLHCVWARVYYELNFQKLRMAAVVAVSAGVEYLPADGREAVQVAEESAQRSGLRREEIVFTGASRNNRTLTIRLRREIPWYVTVCAVGLPGREISVAASAHSSQALGAPTMVVPFSYQVSATGTLRADL